MLGLAGFTAPTAASNNGHNSSSGDRLLVTFHPGMKLSDMGNIHKQIGANVEVIIPGIKVNVVTVPAGKGLNKMNAYHRHGKVRSVEFDYLAQAIDTPDDPYFYKQWGMGKVQAPEAWGVTQGSGDIPIAIRV